MKTSKTPILTVFLCVSTLACTRSTAPRTTPAAAEPPPAGLAIKLTRVYVDDLDRALRVYTDVLGFVVRNDESNGGYRWLTVGAAGDPDGPELQLAPDDDPAVDAYQAAMFQQGQPAAMFFTADVEAEYARLQARGAAITMPPTDVTFAKIAMVDDGCGNLIQITQLY